MNLTDPAYNRFALVREMMETPGIIRAFRTPSLRRPVEALRKTERLFLTGEGSSRIFPAKNAILHALRSGMLIAIQTEGSRQAAELNLTGRVIFGASNSGKTKEVIALLSRHPGAAHFGLTANEGTPLAGHCDETFVLHCGKEEAVAATKSVIEQGLFYHALLEEYAGRTIPAATLQALGQNAAAVLEMPIDRAIVKTVAAAPIIYFAGRNAGAAEEATLKTNEITRKKSAYLEGTYAVHGIEEVMDPKETVIVVEPFPEEEAKFEEVLVKGVGMSVVAVSSRTTRFPTVHIPSILGFDGYIQLLACWNLLVEVGIAVGIDLDKPTRARKIGNEYQAPAA